MRKHKLCPKCKGKGKLEVELSGAHALAICDLCDGAGIVQAQSNIGPPPDGPNDDTGQ